MAPSELRDGDIAESPQWNGGKPVRISRVGGAIRWQDLHARGRAHQIGDSDQTSVTVKARRDGR